MMRMHTPLSTGLLLLALVSPSLADNWTLPLTVSAGNASTMVMLGLEDGATDGYDMGRDEPTRSYNNEIVYAQFPHPEWGVILGGSAKAEFLRDIRGTLPQEYPLEVRTTQSQLTVSWDQANLPARTNLLLINPSAGITVDMARQNSYSFNSGGAASIALKIAVSQGDATPPGVPSNVSVQKRDTTLYVSWAANSETDLAGYKVTYGLASNSSRRTVDVKNVTNYSLFNIVAGETYSVAVSAYDRTGNQSELSPSISWAETLEPRLPAVARLIVPPGDADGAYILKWSASETAGVTYLVQEATDPTFTMERKRVYFGPRLSRAVTGREQGKTYYYRVKAVKDGIKDSAWCTGRVGCAVPGTTAIEGPTKLEVPLNDADGAYAVSWSVSSTEGVSYVLEEALNPIFTAGVRVAYSGPGLTAEITGRLQNRTYYYRVKAVKAGNSDSAWRGSVVKACAIPGTVTVAPPPILTVPAHDADGVYEVAWAASPTSGVSYLVQEATNDTFTTGLRRVYFGPARSANITGRAANTTYYYRVLAVKPGLVGSHLSQGGNGCAIP